VQIVETSNKNIKVGDKFKVNISAEKSSWTKGKGGTGARKPKQPSLREIVLQFIREQRQFNNEQKEFNKRIDSKVDSVIKLNNLKY
jgi:hypothetical protein